MEIELESSFRLSFGRGTVLGVKTYECGVCGYEYDPEAGDPENGIPPGTPFESLPDEWTCPVCEAEKVEFSETE